MARKYAPKTVRVSFSLAQSAMHSIGMNGFEQLEKGYLFTAARMFREASELAALVRHPHEDMWGEMAAETTAKARAKDRAILDAAQAEEKAAADAAWTFGAPLLDDRQGDLDLDLYI